jgi:hypothetical protein
MIASPLEGRRCDALLLCERHAEPDPEPSEQRGDERPVDLDRVFKDKESIFDQSEGNDQ